METNEHTPTMKKFSLLVHDFIQNQSDVNQDALQTCLRELGNLGSETFDLRGAIQNQFYASLHKLLDRLDCRSSLAWTCIGVLEIIRNSPFKNEVEKNFHFAALIGKFLEKSLTVEKKIRLLSLLKDLTYGVKLNQCDAHLRSFFTVLTEWSLSDVAEVVPLALSVLVNMLHQNEVAVYLFLRVTNPKTFMRHFLNKNERPTCRIEVCKLMILLVDVTQTKPEIEELIHFVKMTCFTLGKACSDRDVSLMEHCVTFFVDMVEDHRFCDDIFQNPCCTQGAEMIIQRLRDWDDEHPPKCAMLYLKFLQALIDMPVAGLSPLFPAIANAALCWVKNKVECVEALKVLHSLLSHLNNSEGHVKREIEDILLENMQTVLIPLLENLAANKTPEGRKVTSALLQLLQKAAAIFESSQKIICHELKQEVLQSLFAPLFELCPQEWEFSTHEEETVMYVQLLDLLYDLKCHDRHLWLEMYKAIMRRQEIITVIALTIMYGPCTLKERVLSLIASAGFPAGSVGVLAKTLADMSADKTTVKVGPVAVESPPVTLPPFQFAAVSHIDDFINKLSLMKADNKVQNVPICDLLEIIELKEQLSNHTEEVLLRSINQTMAVKAILEQKLEAGKKEIQFLRRQIHCMRPALEEAHNQWSQSLDTIATKDKEAVALHEKYNEELSCLKEFVKSLREDLCSKTNRITRQNEKISSLESKLNALNDHTLVLETQIDNLERAKKELDEKILSLEEIVEKGAKQLIKSKEEIDKIIKEKKFLEDEKEKHGAHIKELEKEVTHKEQQLSELMRIRDTIYDLTKGKQFKN